MKKLVTLLFFTLCLTACNSKMIQQLVDTPQVKNVQLKSFSAEEKSVVFEVDLFNPNAFPLPLSGLSGDMKLNDLSIGSLDASSEKSLAANSTQTVLVPVKLDTNALVQAAKSVLTQGKAKYNFNGGVKTSIGDVPFSTSGDLSAKDILSAVLK